MNYYIDFDNTLYNTPMLTEKMLKCIASSIYVGNPTLYNKEQIYTECKSMFNRENIYNIYELAEYFSKKYSFNVDIMLKILNDTILNSSELVYEDSIVFLEKLKKHGHKIYLLSYCNESLKYQSLKIAGSNLDMFFDALFIVSKPKYELDINYSNGIFIDDNPSDLEGLYSKNPLKVIRLRRKENKYSIKELNNCNIEEYSDFNEVPID